MSQKQLDDIRQQAEDLTRTIPGSTIAGNLEVFTDLKNTFGSLQEARENLKPFVQRVTALQMIDKRQGGVGKLGSALDLARFIEDQGGAINPKTGHYDPEKFVEIANRTLQVAIATNMRVNPREFLTFQKQARSGGMMLDDHALYGELPYFLKAYGSAKLGTALFSNFQVMLAGRLQRRREEYLESIGIIPKGTGHMVGKGPGAHFEYDPAEIRGRELMMSDPFAWIHDILAPAIAQKYHLNINTSEGQKGVILHMTEAAQRNTIAGMWAEVFRNYAQAQKEARNIEATTPNALAHFA
ncbi:MAG TPA: hypothetical protein VFT74_18335, partial [Isosphaeraceae bacterium]|nr:hypothetical protein [Isosphaeraceae bacterium]